MNTCSCSRKWDSFLILVSATDSPMPKALEVVSQPRTAQMKRILLHTMPPSRARVALMFQHFDGLWGCSLDSGLKTDTVLCIVGMKTK